MSTIYIYIFFLSLRVNKYFKLMHNWFDFEIEGILIAITCFKMNVSREH